MLENHPSLSGLYQVSSEPINKFDLLNLVNETYSLDIEIEPDDDFVCDRSLDSVAVPPGDGISSHPVGRR